MATKRRITPLRAASEQRAADKKQVKAHFDVFASWVETTETNLNAAVDAFRVLRAEILQFQRLLETMKSDLAQYEKREMAYFRGQRGRQKARKGGL